MNNANLSNMNPPSFTPPIPHAFEWESKQREYVKEIPNIIRNPNQQNFDELNVTIKELRDKLAKSEQMNYVLTQQAIETNEQIEKLKKELITNIPKPWYRRWSSLTISIAAGLIVLFIDKYGQDIITYISQLLERLYLLWTQ